MENEKKILTIIHTNNEKQEYEILKTFHWSKTDKNYIIYTDNTLDENGSLNIYAKTYHTGDTTHLDEITTNEEWQNVEKQLKKLMR